MTGLDTKPDIGDLSLLSLLAAHELERLDRREPSDGHYLSALRERLTQQFRPERANIKNFAPSTVQLYRRAVRDATNEDPPDFSALVSVLDNLLDQLRLASETASNDPSKRRALGDLRPLLAFIVSLHGQLLAQKKRSASNRSSNKYRV
jgi:hypothetical protein